jgi:FkbM family methyltransferase
MRETSVVVPCFWSYMLKVVRNFIKMIIRCYPFYRGGVRIANSHLLRELTSEDELVLTNLRRGPRLLVYLNDYCGRSIFYWGDYDRKITWICRKLLRKGDCFLDVGANMGEVGMYAAKFVGPSGQVHFFEPQPKLAGCIRVSAELNGFKHAFIHEVALSGRDGEACLSVPGGNTGMGSLENQGSADSTCVTVQTRNATAYLAELNLPPVRVMKIDVEGHEETLLRGAFDFFKSNRPTAIVFESHDNGEPFFGRGAVKIMYSLGYNFFQIRQKPLFRVQLKKIGNDSSVEAGYDFVALSSGAEREKLSNSSAVI